MDLEQKYTGDRYQIEDSFYSQLLTYTKDEALMIVSQFLAVVPKLPNKENWTQEAAGVIKREDPLFFVVEYLKQEDDIPILVDIYDIGVDEYLEFISNKKSIKSYYNE
jgi:hypothetical protein